MIVRFSNALVGGLALALALACGGSGGSKTDALAPSPAPPATTTIVGSAAKGIIQNGTVTAYELIGGAWTQRGTATTDTKGAYSVVMTGYTGKPTKVTITAGAQSKMVWDGPTNGTHVFGVAEALPADFKMSAVTPVVTGSTINVPVTPYTNMADGLVEESLANANATSIQSAIGAVNVLVGFDTASVPVVDVTDATAMRAAAPTVQRAAAMSAAVTFLAGNGNVGTAVANLSASMAGGGFTAASPITITSLVQAWTAASGNVNIASKMDPSALTGLQLAAQTITSQIANGGYTPHPPVSVPVSQVAAAKGLLGDMRSFVYNVMSTDHQTPLNALGMDLDAKVNVFNRDTLAITQILGIGLEQTIRSIGSTATFQSTLEANGSATYAVPIQSAGKSLGTLTVKVTNPSALTVTLSGSLTGSTPGARTVTVDAKLATNLNIAKVNLVTQTTSQTELKVTTLTASASDGTTSLAITSGEIYATLTGSPQALFFNTLSMTNLGLAIKTGTTSFKGNASFDFIHANPNVVSSYFHSPYEFIGVKSVKLGGSFTMGAVTSTANVELDINNAETFDLDAFLNAERQFWIGSYYGAPDLSAATIAKVIAASRVSAVKPGDSWSIYYGTSAYMGGQYAHSYGSGTRNGQYVSFNPDNKDDYTKLMAAFNPNVALAGVLATLPAGTVVTDQSVYLTDAGWNSYGVLVQIPPYVEKGSNFLNATFKTDFTATGITGLPTVAVSAIVNRKTLAGGDAAFTLTWGASTYTVNVTATDVNAGTGSVTIKSPQGVEMTVQSLNLNKGMGNGSILVSGVKVADVAVLSNGLVKITYSDGTFESFQ